MYKVTRRSNLIPFLLILAVGVGISIYVPNFFQDTKFEIPAFALFPGEIAIALIMSVLVFENATPAEIIKIAGIMLVIAFVDGAICNVVGKQTSLMPDSTLQLNWVQLIAFNVTGLAGIISIYTNVPADEGYGGKDSAVRAAEPAKEASPAKIDFSPQEALSQIDEGRFEKQEQVAPEKMSLESLFSEETQAAGTARKESKAAQSVQSAEPQTSSGPEPVKEEPKPVKEEPKPEPVAEAKAEVEPVKAEPAKGEAENKSAGLLQDVSSDIEDIFGSLAGDAASKDFTAGAKESGKEEVSPAKEPVKAEETPAAPEPVKAEAPKAESSFGPKMGEAGSAEKAVKEIGKLSASAGNQPEVAGTLKTIGQMLLDTRAVERIIKESVEKQEGGTKWRVLTVDRGADLQALMDKLASFAGVESALLMGKDGLLLSNTESVSAQKYVFGPLSLAMHSTTNLGTSKLQMGELRQALLRSGDKLAVLTDVGSAILAVFGNWELENIDQLMNHINQSIAGSEAVSGDLPADMAAPNLTGEPEPVKQEEPAAAESKGGPVNVSDKEVGEIFDNLMSEKPAEKKEEAPAADSGKLMNVSDKEVGELFDNLMSDKPAEGEKKSMDFSPAEEKKGEEKKEEKEEKKEEPAQAPSKAEEAPAAEAKPEGKKDKDKKKEGKPPEHIKEFGKLSVQAAKQDTGGGEGAMKAIGRQLIDVQAVENIIKSGEKREKIGSGLTTARVISAARGEGIKTLLNRIDSYEGVIGSLIVGHDGMVIASTLSGGLDKDVMGALCTAIHSHLDVAVKKVDKGKLQQCVFVGAGDKLTVMTSVAVGILAVFVDNAGIEKVDGLLNAIETTVKG